jgi:magnesium transporter
MTAVYAIATPRRLVVELREAAVELDVLRDRMPWTSDHLAAAGLFIFVELVVRSFRAEILATRSELDELEEQVLESMAGHQLLELNALHRRVGAMRRALGEYSDALDEANERLATGVALPPPVARLARAHSAAVDRTVEALSMMRDEVTNTMELHRSLTTTRQAMVINRLTVISALVLPLAFITGFFGMNFAWLTDHIDSPAAFWVLGVAMPTMIAVVVLVLMWRAGWLLVLSDRAARVDRRSRGSTSVSDRAPGPRHSP